MKAERAGWLGAPLQQLTSLIRDGTHGTHADVEEGIPLLSAKDIRDGRLDIPDNCRLISEQDYALLHKSYELQQDDVLLTIVGSIGRCCLVPKGVPRFTFQRSVAVVRASHVKPGYLYQYFQSAAFQQCLEDATNASAQGGVYLASLAKLHVSFPESRAEQSKIAEVLSTVDRAIAQTEALIAKQQRIKTGLMQDLLTRGIDEHGQLRSEATHAFKDSPLGRIPVEWEVEPLGSICEFASGGTPSRTKDAYWGGNIAWVKTGEIDYRIITRTEETITEAGLRCSSAKLMPRGTLLMAIYGEGVTRAKVAILGINAATNQACLAFFPHERMNTTFLYWYFVHRYERLRRLSNEGSQKNLSSNIMKTLDVPIPSVREQGRIVTALQRLDTAQSNERTRFAKLRSLKTALMQDLLTGKVRVTPLLEPAGEASA